MNRPMHASDVDQPTAAGTGISGESHSGQQPGISAGIGRTTAELAGEQNRPTLLSAGLVMRTGYERETSMQHTDNDGVRSGTELAARINPESAPARIGVLIAHGSPLISAGLASVLTAQPEFEVFYCGDNGGSQRPSPEDMAFASVAVTDCATGLEMAADASNACQIVIFTEDQSELSIRLAVQRGVSGYLLLDSGCGAIVSAVRSAYNGAAALDPIVAAKVVASLTAPVLSSRETEVLSFIMAGLSDKTIAERLSRSLETVKSHVKSVLAKLDVRSRSEAAAVAHRRGLVTPVTEPVTLPVVSRLPRILRSTCGRPNTHSAGGELGNRWR